MRIPGRPPRLSHSSSALNWSACEQFLLSCAWWDAGALSSWGAHYRVFVLHGEMLVHCQAEGHITECLNCVVRCWCTVQLRGTLQSVCIAWWDVGALSSRGARHGVTGTYCDWSALCGWQEAMTAKMFVFTFNCCCVVLFGDKVCNVNLLCWSGGGFCRVFACTHTYSHTRASSSHTHAHTRTHTHTPHCLLNNLISTLLVQSSTSHFF